MDMNIQGKKNLALTFLLAAMFFALPCATKAVNTDTVGILPANPDPNVRFSDSWFIYHEDLGQTKTDAIKVINNRNQTVVVELYPVDAVTTTDGAFALLPQDAPRNDIGGWIKLAASEVELAPQQTKIIPFQVTIPQNADVGDHLGGIIMQEIQTGDTLAGTGVKIVTRVGVRMYETVPGAVTKQAEITSFDWRYVPTGVANFWKDFLDINQKTVFVLGIKNDGNVRLTPQATVDVKNMFGRTVAHLTDQNAIGSVFPHQEISEGQVVWNGMPLFGRYTVNMKLDFAEGGIPQQTRSIVIWAIPYKILFLLIFLAVIIILGRLITKYFLEAAKEKMPIYTVKSGDSLAGLAEKFALPWKTIARVNDIKQPFHITVGEKLFISIKKKNKSLLAAMLASKELDPSLAQSSGAVSNGKKKAVIIIVVVLVGLAAAYGLKKMRDNQLVHQQVNVPPSAQPAPVETPDKTAGGAFKKSSVSVSINTLPNGDPQSSQRIYNRFHLAGYNVTLMSGNEKEAKYAATTIEYNDGKKDQADMVKNDLGVTDDIAEVDVPGLGTDVVIYNALDKNNFLDFQEQAAQ